MYPKISILDFSYMENCVVYAERNCTWVDIENSDISLFPFLGFEMACTYAEITLIGVTLGEV